MQRMETLETVLAREDEVAREWQWLNDALNEVARVRAERGDAAVLPVTAAAGIRSRTAARRPSDAGRGSSKDGGIDATMREDRNTLAHYPGRW